VDQHNSPSADVAWTASKAFYLSLFGNATDWGLVTAKHDHVIEQVGDVARRSFAGCHVLSRSVTFCHVLSRSVTFCHVLSRSVTFCHVLSRSVTFCHGWLVGTAFSSVGLKGNIRHFFRGVTHRGNTLQRMFETWRERDDVTMVTPFFLAGPWATR
jgi:hypothetical protein